MLLLALVAFESLACIVPKPGSQFSLEELIDKSERIVLVELEKTEKHTYGIKYYLRPIQSIKGKAGELLEFYGHLNEHEESTYLDHNNPVFWFMDVGRSEWPCCICGPDHTFEKGFQYLYFPDYLGARKSAEIINNKEDRWYKFVKDRVNNSIAHNKSLN